MVELPEPFDAQLYPKPYLGSARPIEIDPIEQFQSVVEQFGLKIDHRIQADGKFHRVPDSHAKHIHNDSGWYVLEEVVPGLWYGNFGSWKAGRGRETWCSKSDATLTGRERSDIATARHELDQKIAKSRELAANYAEERILNSPPADPSHLYLKNKAIKSYGLHQDGGSLLVPARDAGGQIVTYQTITSSGEKRFLKGGAKKGHFFMIGQPSDIIYVCEGYATGASIHEATDQCVVVAFDANNLAPVVDAIRPLAQKIVIAADNDPSGVGVSKANEAMADQVVAPIDVNDFNDLHQSRGLTAVREALGAPPRAIKATPLGIIDPSQIPRRPWLFGDQLLRGYVSVYVAPPGVGKSTLTMQIAIAVAAGIDFADFRCHEQGNVWVFNNEDDRDELHRRIVAAAQSMNVSIERLKDRLFLDTGDERPLLVAKLDRNGGVIQTPDVDACIAEIRRRGIKLLIIDPFAETHTVNENSNDDIKQVATMLRRIARETSCAILLVHHTRKAADGVVGGVAGNMDSARGASALLGVARVVSTLFPMSKKDAEALSVPEEQRYQYVRLDGAKANLSLVTRKARWFKRVSVRIANGDDVGSLMPWQPPDPFEDVSTGDLLAIQKVVQARADDGKAFGPTARSQNNWVGQAIATQLNLDPKKDKALLKQYFKGWQSKAMFKVELVKNPHGDARKAVRVDKWAAK